MKTFNVLKETARLMTKESLMKTFWLYLSILIVHSGLCVIILNLEKNIIDKATNVSVIGIQSVIFSVLIFFLFSNIINIFWVFRFLLMVVFGPKLDLVLRKTMISKIMKLDLIYFEDSEMFDVFNKAQNATRFAVTSFTSVFQTLAAHLATMIGIMIYVSYLNPLFIIILACAAIPKILNYRYSIKKKVQLEDELANVRRKKGYYDECITSKNYFKETRIFNSFKFFKNLFVAATSEYNQKNWNVTKKLFPMQLVIEIVNFLSYIITFGLAIYLLSKGQITIGAFAVVFSALQQLEGRVNTIIGNIGRIAEQNAIAKNYFSFLELKESAHSKNNEITSPIKKIEFNNVCFSYPSNNNDVIKDLSLIIDKKETIAVIGLNGAGKTTFIKLLMGLLYPSSGTIKYNDQNITEIDENSIYNKQTAIFQNYGKYSITMKENVAISDIDNVDDEDRVYSCLNKVGFAFEKDRFPDKLKTKLGVEFGGTELSGGQWQLIALSRAYFRERELITLDEPSASIDPLRENELFLQFQNLSDDKLTLIVTHRLNAAKMADRILVFEDGKIIEDGSHDELLKAQGKYTYLFNEQAKWYNGR